MKNKKLKSFLLCLIVAIISGSMGVIGATYFTASQVSYTPSDTSWKVTDTNAALNSLYSDLVTGKGLIATALTNKGVSTSSTAPFSTMASNIGQITSDFNLEFISTTNYSDTNPSTPESITLTRTALTGNIMVVVNRGYTGANWESVYPLNVTTSAGTLTQVGYFTADSKGGPRSVIKIYLLKGVSNATVTVKTTTTGYNYTALTVFQIK